MILSKIYSDGMMLQRNRGNVIDGQTKPETKVVVSFMGIDYDTVSDEEGFFDIMLNPAKEGGPYVLTINDTNETVMLNDVYLGDVFLLAGQSNMELPVSRTLDLYANEVGKKDYPLIRMFQTPKDFKFGEPDQILSEGEWIEADKKNVMNFSALGFYFAEFKHNEDKVPIGLVHAAVGGTHIEAFMSEEKLMESAEKMIDKARAAGRPTECRCNNINSTCKSCYKEALKKDKDETYVKSTVMSELKRMEDWSKRVDSKDKGFLEKWESHEWSDAEKAEGILIDVPSSWIDKELGRIIGSVWVQTSVEVPGDWCGKKIQLRLGTIVDADITYVNGKQVGRTEYFYPPRRYWLDEDVLVPGKNIITVRVVINNNVGEFKKDMPYCLKMGDEEISLEGKWNARIAAIDSPMGPQTFFTWQPTSLYNKMIYPLRNISFDSVIFYQGESNTAYPEDYEYLMEDMVEDWRTLFGSDIPFIFMELPYFKGETWETESDDWTRLREAQERAVKNTSNTKIVDLYDLGQYNEIHIQNKKVAAERLYSAYKGN